MANKQYRAYIKSYGDYIQKRHRYNWHRKARVAAWVTLLLLAMCATAAVVG